MFCFMCWQTDRTDRARSSWSWSVSIGLDRDTYFSVTPLIYLGSILIKTDRDGSGPRAIRWAQTFSVEYSGFFLNKMWFIPKRNSSCSFICLSNKIFVIIVEHYSNISNMSDSIYFSLNLNVIYLYFSCISPRHSQS